MRKRVVALVFMFCTSSLFSGDVVKVEAGIGLWNASPTGDFQYKGPSISLEDDFGLKEESIPYFYADIEHPLPIIPNVRVEYTNLDYSGTTDTIISFGGKTYNVGSKTSDMSMTTLDMILYYNLWESFGLNLDLGLDLRSMDATISVKNATLSEETSHDAIIPHLYSNIRYDLPVIDLGIEANMKYFTFDGATSYDAGIKIDYEIYLGLGLEVGYRTIKFDVSESFAADYDIDSTFNIDFSGPYFGLKYKF